MEVKELMIGDWVKIKLSQHLTTVNSLTGISVYTEAAFPLRYDEIEPIPLTPEILEKNGFKVMDILYDVKYRLDFSEHLYGKYIDCYPHKNENLKVSQWFTVYIVFNEVDFSHSQSCSIQFGFVHELQHALRLCGIEKTIEL